MRKYVIAGNWKMNKNAEEAEVFFKQLADYCETADLNHTEIIVCPPSLYLMMANDFLYESSVMLSSQDVSSNNYGAYTGEICADMLRSINVPYSVIGHSERRKYHNESNEIIREKFDQLVSANLIPILCVGETWEEREHKQEFEVVKNQLESVIKNNENISDRELPTFYIAYEPVWAIGTGKTATPNDAQIMHKYIRKLLSQSLSRSSSEAIPLLYGGSVKPENIKELLNQDDVDGALIGGASLKFSDFISMIETAIKM